MTVNTHNPSYDLNVADWLQMRDTYDGERAVKAEGTKYLPLTAGMISDGAPTSDTKGTTAYNCYRARAVVPDTVTEAVESLLGVMHRKPATIELPEQMEFLRDDATVMNESLQMLLRRINEEQLISGRAGILADVADSGERKDKAYLSIYFAERIINWDEGRSDGIEIENLNLVVINETEEERLDHFEWEEVEKYRVLILTEDESTDAVEESADGEVENIPEGEGVYQAGVIRVTGSEGSTGEFDSNEMEPIKLMGQTLDEIPFVFINSRDIVPEPDRPPLIGLSNLTLTIYRGEADYRQSLFMQGQDTLVIIGRTEEEDDDQRVGAGATLRIVNSEFGDAKYIGVESTGLVEQREALQNDYNRAGEKGAKLLDSVSGSQQSGDALRIRVAAKTATLTQVALAGAFGLQSILRIVARWMNLDDQTVTVTPNLDFAADMMPGRELIDWITSKALGAPIALETIHTLMEQRGVTELTFKDELQAIEGEEDIVLGNAETEGGDPEPDGDDDGGEE